MEEKLNAAIGSLGIQKTISELSKKIGGALFSSKDDVSFQRGTTPCLTSKIRDLVNVNTENNILSLFFTMHKLTKPQVLNVQLVSVQVYDTFIMYSMSVDIADKSSKVKLQDSSIGRAYDAELLINTRMELYFDYINDVEFLTIAEFGVAKRIGEANIQDDDSHLLPVGLVSGAWSALPSALELIKPYGPIPAGTTLELDVDRGSYVSSEGWIPAVMYHLVSFSRLPVTPDPNHIFATAHGEDDEDAMNFQDPNDFAQDDDSQNDEDQPTQDDDDGLQDFLRTL